MPTRECIKGRRVPDEPGTRREPLPSLPWSARPHTGIRSCVRLRDSAKDGNKMPDKSFER